MTRRLGLAAVAAVVLSAQWAAAGEATKVERFARFQVGEDVHYGVVEGDQLRVISGDLFGAWKPTETVHDIGSVKLLVPTDPLQVFALAGNWKSHLGTEEIPEKLRIPQPFYKPHSALLEHGGNIVIPKDSPGPVHYEAELVIVIGKKAKNVPREKALEYVFGVTCGNDVSERFWQNDEEHKDVQWWRAKGSDTFGPCGPFIARGLDYDNLQLTLRHNGEVKQQENTDHFIHNVPAVVSFLSQYVTLHPGDLIFTGTPGKTQAIQPGDVVEVELEGVGVLRNGVVAEE